MNLNVRNGWIWLPLAIGLVACQPAQPPGSQSERPVSSP